MRTSEKFNENIILLDPYQLRSHEEIRLSRALFILFKIILAGNFTMPLLIDSKTKTILDGHHRRWVACRLKFKSVPCYSIDYLSDEKVRVYGRRPEIFVDKSQVINTALERKLFPHKTTRHEYKIPEFEPLSLDELWK